MNKLSMKVEKMRVRNLLWLVIGMGIWQIGASSGLFPSLLLPGIPEIFTALYRSFVTGKLWLQLLTSLFLIFSGLAAGVVGAVVLTGFASVSERFKGLVEFLVTFLHPLPGIALLPVIVLWFGTGGPAVFIIIVHSALWPMLTNLLSGYRTIPEEIRLTGENYRLSPWAGLINVTLPGVLPAGSAGLRIGWARAWRGLISAEMVFGAIGKEGGIGWFIFNRRVFMDTPGIFAGLLVVIGVGLAAENLLFEPLEKWTIRRWETG